MKRKYWLLLIAALAVAYWSYDELVDSFSVRSIHLDTWPTKNYEPPICLYSKELAQPYTYLGKGRQFYVFGSSDGKYVLKFIKCQRIDIPTLLKPFTSDKRFQDRLARIDGIFSSLALASGPFQECTGVLYAQLAKRSGITQEVELIDKLGIHHTISLENVPFVLQKRAVPLLECLEELIAKNDIAEAKVRLNQLIQLFEQDVSLSCYDTDSGIILRNNVGFLPDCAIHIDIGTLTHQPPQHTFERLQPLQGWLQDKKPELADYFSRVLGEGV